MDPELKKKVESVLFAVGRKMDVNEIAKLVGTRDLEHLKGVLSELKFDYEQSDRGIVVQNDGDFWKLAVRDRYAPVISKIVTQTELTKSVMETLAVIAYKAPMMQSDVIKIRTNKAYDHMVELEKLGYVTRKKKGRTKEVKLAEKFFEYFDVPPDRLKDKFRSVAELEEVVKQKEDELAQRKENITSKIESSKQHEESQKAQAVEEIRKIEEHIDNMPHIELIDDAGRPTDLKIVDTIEIVKESPLEGTQLEEAKDKLGDLDIVATTTKPEQGEPEFLEGMQVYDRKQKSKAKKSKEKAQPQESPSQVVEQSDGLTQVAEPMTKDEPEGPEAPSLFGEKPSQQIEEIIDLKIKELLTPKQEDLGDGSPTAQSKEEPKGNAESKEEVSSPQSPM